MLSNLIFGLSIPTTYSLSLHLLLLDTHIFTSPFYVRHHVEDFDRVLIYLFNLNKLLFLLHRCSFSLSHGVKVAQLIGNFLDLVLLGLLGEEDLGNLFELIFGFSAVVLEAIDSLHHIILNVFIQSFLYQPLDERNIVFLSLGVILKIKFNGVKLFRHGCHLSFVKFKIDQIFFVVQPS